MVNEGRSFMRRIALAGISVAVVFATVAFTSTAGAKTIHVHEGDSIQKGVNKAGSGDTVLVDPGTYKEKSHSCLFNSDASCAVALKKKNVALAAKSGKKNVTLKAKGDQENGIGVGKTVSPDCLTDGSKRLKGSLVSGFIIKGFKDNGLFLACTENWRVTDVEAKKNLEYGIFPSHAVNGRVDHSFASGANDTGIYIGQSRDIRIDHNEAKKNVSGFEIENSSDVRADHNESTGNTGGILSFSLPNLDVKSNSDNRIDHNTVTANNKANTCLEPGDAVCGVPVGTGILLLAVDTNNVDQNQVTDNGSYGIAVANYCNFNDCTGGVDIDPDPDNNHVVTNTVTGNGTARDPIVPAIFAKDLAWDLSGTGNCWTGNTVGTTFPATLPPC
jgi:parallel beta-helix repeat protein